MVSNVDTRSTSSARDGARTLCVVMPPLPDRAGVCMSPPLSMRRLIHLCPVRELKPTLSWGRIWSFCPLLCGGRCDSQKTDGSCVLCEDHYTARGGPPKPPGPYQPSPPSAGPYIRLVPPLLVVSIVITSAPASGLRKARGEFMLGRTFSTLFSAPPVSGAPELLRAIASWLTWHLVLHLTNC